MSFIEKTICSKCNKPMEHTLLKDGKIYEFCNKCFEIGNYICDVITTSNAFCNDLLDENDKVIGVVGDSGWDLATTFINDIVFLYERHVGRKPTQEEVLSTVKFVIHELPERIQ